MALNGRGLIDPRWAYHQRPVPVSAMLARIKVLHTGRTADTWNPAAGQTFPGVLSHATVHYQGRARVQPNNDWRARKNRWEGETFTEHAMRIQLDLTGNEVTNPEPLPKPSSSPAMPGDAGVIHVNDVVEIIEMFSPNGYPIDGMIQAYTYIVRNIVPSSNSWVRTLLCDYNVNDASGVS